MIDFILDILKQFGEYQIYNVLYYQLKEGVFYGLPSCQIEKEISFNCSVIVYAWESKYKLNTLEYKSKESEVKLKNFLFR